MWLPPNFPGILPELKPIPNWVLAGADKAPRQPDGKLASVAAPRTWSTFEQVQAAYRPGHFIGVGFVIDGKPHYSGKYLHGFDWDHCIERGDIDPAVMAKVNELGIERLEVSVSGKGLRGFFLHDELLPSHRTQIAERSVELYSDRRYLITTGWAFSGKEVLA
jgi:primase-polymerase (primpol)-like protein